MIIEEIKNAVRNAINKEDSDIIFHFEEIKHTGFPFVVFNIKNFNIASSNFSKKCDFALEICYMKSSDNKISELLEGQEMLSKALLPALLINDKKVTLDDVIFSISDSKLLMNFNLEFYAFEKEEGELMETLDITIKEK